MGVESDLVLWLFTDECCHPNRFRVELMLIESCEIGRLDFPNRDTLESTHCFLPNENKMSCAGRERALPQVKGCQSSKSWIVRRPGVSSIAWLDRRCIARFRLAIDVAD